MAAAKINSATSKVANAFPHPTITIQRNKHASPASSAGSWATIAKTPKTSADEGIDFFESAIGHGEAPIRVYELPLEPDGGPSKSREVRLSFRCKRNYCHVDKPLPSTFVSLPQMFRIFSAFRWRQAHRHLETGCSRLICPSMEVHLTATTLWNAGE